MKITGTILTMNPNSTVIPHGSITITDSRIAAIETLPPRAANEPHRLIIPGLINAHTHCGMTLLRGASETGTTSDWLTAIRAYEQNLTREAVYASSCMGLLEMIRGGITTVADMYLYPDATAEACATIGMRSIVGAHVITDDDYAVARRFCKTWSSKHPLITPTYAPHAPYSTPPALLKDVIARARSEERIILIHLLEQASEWSLIERAGYRTLASFFHASGLDTVRSCVAHAVHIPTDELSHLAAIPMGIAHCPTSNGKLQAGIAPIREMVDADIPVGLGTDSAASNNRLSILNELHLACIAQGYRTPAASLSAHEALRMATIDGARALGIDDQVGSIEIGKQADLVVIELNPLTTIPDHDPFTTIAHATDRCDVSDVMIAGTWRMKNKELTISREEYHELLKRCSHAAHHVRNSPQR